jgi:hypothetical protein
MYHFYTVSKADVKLNHVCIIALCVCIPSWSALANAKTRGHRCKPRVGPWETFKGEKFRQLTKLGVATSCCPLVRGMGAGAWFILVVSVHETRTSATSVESETRAHPFYFCFTSVHPLESVPQRCQKNLQHVTRLDLSDLVYNATSRSCDDNQRLTGRSELVTTVCVCDSVMIIT